MHWARSTIRHVPSPLGCLELLSWETSLKNADTKSVISRRYCELAIMNLLRELYFVKRDSAERNLASHCRFHRTKKLAGSYRINYGGGPDSSRKQTCG